MGKESLIMSGRHLLIKQKFLPDRKMPFYDVFNKDGDYLGVMAYRNTWRCYVWRQNLNVDMSETCMVEAFGIVKGMEQRRKAKE